MTSSELPPKGPTCEYHNTVGSSFSIGTWGDTSIQSITIPYDFIFTEVKNGKKKKKKKKLRCSVEGCKLMW